MNFISKLLGSSDDQKGKQANPNTSASPSKPRKTVPAQNEKQIDLTGTMMQSAAIIDQIQSQHTSQPRARLADVQTLEKENKLIKQQNNLVMDALLSKNTGADDQLQTVFTIVKVQRERIDSLEQQYDELYNKYCDLLRTTQPQVVSKGEPVDNDNLEYEVLQLKMKNKILEDQVEELTRKYAMQFAKIKSELTEQGAQLLVQTQKDSQMFELLRSSNTLSQLGNGQNKQFSSSPLKPLSKGPPSKSVLTLEPLPQYQDTPSSGLGSKKKHPSGIPMSEPRNGYSRTEIPQRTSVERPSGRKGSGEDEEFSRSMQQQSRKVDFKIPSSDDPYNSMKVQLSSQLGKGGQKKEYWQDSLGGPHSFLRKGSYHGGSSAARNLPALNSKNY